MTFTKLLAVTACAIAALSVGSADVLAAKDKKHWGYHGKHAAQYWGDISEDYALCKTGKEQSPINIDRYAGTDLEGMRLEYQPTPLSVVNNGHTIQANFTEGSKMMVGDASYDLLQLHFHTPSEHYIDGAPYPMEAHFVHKDANGGLAVLGVLIKVGDYNRTVDMIWTNAPSKKGETVTDENMIMDVTDLLPNTRNYFRYDGSLTTPPCSEGVKWHVLTAPVEISADQLTAFQEMFPVNARPIQPLNDRVIQGR